MYNIIDKNGFPVVGGRSRATVLDNRDPLQRGRIQVKHPQLGDTVWIEYLRIPFVFDVPSIGDIVFIECEAGVHTHPIAWGNATKGTDASPQIGEEFRRDIPTNRGMKTPGGHLLELDDGIATLTNNPDDTQFTEENRGVRITSTAGNKIHIIEDSTSGQQFILLQDAGGNVIKLDYENNQLNINSIGNTNIDTADSKNETVGADDSLSVSGDKTDSIGGDKISSVSGNETKSISGNLTINVNGDVNITSENASVSANIRADIESPLIELNAATQVNATTPLFNVSGFVACSGIATGGATPSAGDAIIDGNLETTGDVSDSAGSMQDMRDTFNPHTHIDSVGGTTTGPDTTM